MSFLKKGLVASLALMGLAAVSSNIMAASYYDTSKYVKIDINSGNPTFPFPQFLEYKEGKTLAKYNAEGVTHADMEKTMREAYQIMSHRARYTGKIVSGVPYVNFNSKDVESSVYAPHCTEGDGYMLLASAIFADQATFNGLWMWIHDNRIPNVERYQDGEINFKDYAFGTGLPSCYANAEENSKTEDGSATDGDEDIALALVIAHKQWGDTMMQDGKPVKDFNGNTISYRKMAKDYLSAFVDTFMYTSSYLDGSIYMGGHMSGDIGIDGYVKGGNKSHELTNWRSTQTIYPDITQNSNISGGGGDAYSFTDYCAPSYYNEFAKWLEEDNKKNPDPSNEWRINQYKRAEASSDWLMGEAYKQGLYPSIGKTNIKNDTVVSFDQFSVGEDFRTPWRTVLNYLWHGNPATTWDPKAHQVKDGANTFEKDMAFRYAELMKNPKDENGDVECGKLGASPDPNSLNWFGPAQIKTCYNMDGTQMTHFNANYALGCSGPSVVALGDLELLGDIYRECELRFDNVIKEDIVDEDRYINATAEYFHGWFRTLGMLVTSGNLAAPMDMKPGANVKVYMSVDKTFAYKGDNVTYGVQCRNYGAADAKSAVITTQLDPNYEFVSATKGGVYNASSHSIIWKIGDIPGFKTGKLDATMDSVSFTVSVKDTLNRRVALTSTISGSNFDEWTSNEYPNNATYTMERNLVDIIDAPISLEKQVSATEIAINDTVDFVINITPAKANMLCGGRENIRLSYGNYHMDNYPYLYQYYRLFNDASEAYINLGDYRVSYFLYDTCGVYSEENEGGFKLTFDNQMDAEKYGYYEEGNEMKFDVEDLESGEDENGKWNKRIVIKFPNILSATTSHLYKCLDNKYQIHKGVWGPLFYRTRYEQLGKEWPVSILDKVSDDWSFTDDVLIERIDGQGENLSLVSPGWYNEDQLGEELTKYARHSCDEDVVGFDRILVEQWDGYTWRRIQGTSPIKTNCYKKVVFTDTLPKGLKLIADLEDLEGAGASFDENTRVLKFEIPEISSEKVLQYRCVVEKDIETGDLKIGGANITAGDITAESNTVKVTVKEPTDVKNVKIFNQNELVDVYNANGALLRKQVEFKDALIGLQSGVYMVNGVKMIVK